MNSSHALPFVAVGIGNTSLKVGLFSGDSSIAWPVPEKVVSMTTHEAPFDELLAWLPATPATWRVASVQREAEKRLAEWVRRQRPADDYRPLSYRELPLTICVDAPERVGIDRLAAAVGVNALREPDRPAIFIDTGTAITVNLVNAQGAFEGGAILPGVGMSARALADFADLLPWVNAEPGNYPPAALGKSTDGAIKSGLYWGAVGAIREIGGKLSSGLVQPPQWFLTGGDAAFLAPQFGLNVQYEPYLVLGGIFIATR